MKYLPLDVKQMSINQLIIPNTTFNSSEYKQNSDKKQFSKEGADAVHRIEKNDPNK